MCRSLSQDDPFQSAVARRYAPLAREAVEPPANQVTPRVAAERVAGEQRRVDQHDDRADADAEAAVAEERGKPLPHRHTSSNSAP